MIVDLIKLKESKKEFDFLLTPDQIDLENEQVILINSVTVKGELKKGIAQTDVEGEISAVAETNCSRCLQTTECSLEIAFKAVFVTPENYSESTELELGGDDLEVSVFNGDQIDLTELVREQILLNFPTHILCRENCQGLCPQCGANQNLIDCNCREKEIDPRWKTLEDLKF